ncbi:hypothetical protein PFICI_01480 [Pestalotiopsis fici W106-1]|uniref:Uncharacterized protein n=1 Tax=Pestalotiopsis fici (strain W106-1 / CGMCC3.15140) TaxID=1229662 RepID=W3XQ66_PESFW|nr:uncharacterized protein PFICI_01480 [Pestalotiopsis fici W106-1]ETS87652.1 hypothetical protein PFICI_01480 [Pestalotiopsis fici W106-1]
MSGKDRPLQNDSPAKMEHEQTQKFDYFPMLPKELQLLIWEHYETVNLRVRHMFCGMDEGFWDESCYYDFNQTSFPELVWSSGRNIRHPRSLLGFVDLAVARRYEIMLPNWTYWAPFHGSPSPDFDHEFAQPPAGFCDDNSWSRVPTWMNFKVDSFCFIPRLIIPFYNSARRRHSTPFPPPPLGLILFHDFDKIENGNKKTPWFWSIQNLELFITSIGTGFYGNEEHALAIHPALKSVKLLVAAEDLTCTHEGDGKGTFSGDRVLNDFLKGKRTLSDDLSTVLSQWNTSPHNVCDCGLPRKFLRELLELRDNIYRIVKDRVASVQIIAAGGDDHIHWTQPEALAELHPASDHATQ